MTQTVATILTLPVSERDHIQGSLDAPVTLVEYGDYECPYCGQAHLVMKALQQQVGDLMCFVFRNFPLTTMHPHAAHAAEAAEAAGAQGKFWEMHDTLYEYQDALSDPDLVEYAGALGLDVGRFTKEMVEHRYANRVQEDFMSGVRSGVNGTPTFFINGGRYNGSYDPRSMLAAIMAVSKEAIA
jgi:protein-disulfide isomerase